MGTLLHSRRPTGRAKMGPCATPVRTAPPIEPEEVTIAGPMFDEIARGLARGLPRRRLLGVFAGGLAVALIGVPKRRSHALAQDACAERLFPADNVWNVPVADLPVDPNSDAYVASIGIDEGLHPD